MLKKGVKKFSPWAAAGGKGFFDIFCVFLDFRVFQKIRTPPSPPSIFWGPPPKTQKTPKIEFLPKMTKNVGVRAPGQGVDFPAGPEILTDTFFPFFRTIGILTLPKQHFFPLKKALIRRAPPPPPPFLAKMSKNPQKPKNPKSPKNPCFLR